MAPKPEYTEAKKVPGVYAVYKLCHWMGQTCLATSLLEKEEGNILGACFLLSLLVPTFSQLTGLWKGPLQRKRDALTEAGPHQKSREGRGGRGVLAAPRVELLNPGHRLSSQLI